MERYERDKYYHGGLGTENRRDWDRSTRDGDFGRDYENRFRTHHDRNEDYRRHHHNLENHLNDLTGAERRSSEDLRRGYGVSSLGGYGSRYDRTDYVTRMEPDQEMLQDWNSGSGRVRGYSGAAFGGSNYSSDGSFGGSSAYGSMSSGRGNEDDYVSMSGYGGGYGDSSVHSDRGVPNYSSPSRSGDQYGYDAMGSRSTYGGQNYGGGNSGSSWGRDNYSAAGNYGGYGSSRNSDNEMNYRSYGTGQNSVYERRNFDRNRNEDYNPYNW